MYKNKFNYKQISMIEGWLSFIDFELMKTIIYKQNEFIKGSLVEIGVHHGKSLILMAKFSKEDDLYVIDLFNEQKKNISFSGKGDIDIFLNNLKKFEINKKRLKIDNRLSTEVKKIDILNNVNPSRFFHIDGGHDYETVLNDIKLATEVTLDEGIIAIDDVFRPEWPEVSMAVFQSEELEKRNFACFAIGFNKSYYCNKKYFNKYQEILLKNKSLTRFLEKKYISKKYKVLIFQDYPLPEWNYKQIIWWFLKTYIPNFYLNLKKFLKK